MSDQTAKVKGVVDLVFLIDVTGSMGHCIEALKSNIKSFIQTMTQESGPNDAGPPIKDFRIKVVGFRDATCDAEWFVEHPFTTSVEEVFAHIGSLKADGGRDEPESLLDALHKVSSMGQTESGAAPDPSKWRFRRAATRVIVVFTDASFHPTMSYPEGRGGGVVDVQNAATANRIFIEFFAPDVDCFADIESIDRCNGHKIPFDRSAKNGAAAALEHFTRDKANFTKVMTALAKSVSKSAEVPLL